MSRSSAPGRPVAAIVDLSRLGEFETCKALLNLVNLGYLGPAEPGFRRAPHPVERDQRR